MAFPCASALSPVATVDVIRCKRRLPFLVAYFAEEKPIFRPCEFLSARPRTSLKYRRLHLRPPGNRPVIGFSSEKNSAALATVGTRRFERIMYSSSGQVRS